MRYTQSTIKWYQVERDLFATLCELRSIYAKIYFAEMGELPDGIVRDDLEDEIKFEQGEVSEREFFFDGLLGVYHGLNYVWATRIPLARRIWSYTLRWSIRASTRLGTVASTRNWRPRPKRSGRAETSRWKS